MLKKINRQEAIKRFPILPLRHYDKKEGQEIFTSPRVFANYILTIPSKSYKGHQKLLAAQITAMVKNLGGDHLVFLGDIDLAWLFRLNKYEIFQEALQYLAAHKVGKRFNGALQVSTDELPVFIKNLMWLVRTNGVVQYIHFTDPGQHFVADICQYGNLHISTMNETADKRFKSIVAESSLIFTTEEMCYNKFSKSGAIKERKSTW